MTPVYSVSDPIPLAVYSALPVSAKPQVSANSPPSPIHALTSSSVWLSRSPRDNHSCLLTQAPLSSKRLSELFSTPGQHQFLIPTHSPGRRLRSTDSIASAQAIRFGAYT
jgi:hypothetical protein